ncbi:MAG: TonB-dependent receptor plug domain-containing protein [Hyphomonadaceae bacterium JAD_PAG50586_4]|nr:MAG: TonB-dependent receptor plug domain-containing protein [Hyphomonadaceae bacterium JAD_PAG50586_4]
MTKSAPLLGVCLGALASVSGIGSAAAQEAVTVESDEIVVTANRREERITEVPFAVTAIGAEEIDERGSNDIKDLQYSVPGLNIQELSPGANRTILRGINPGAGTGLPIVGTYVDEVGISIDQQQRDGLFPLVDLERDRSVARTTRHALRPGVHRRHNPIHHARSFTKRRWRRLR